VLTMPPAGKPDDAPMPLRNHVGLFGVYKETRDWNRLLGVETVTDLDRKVIEGGIGEVIRVAEALHERKIAAIADEVHARPDCRLVLVAGPSSSGKTTFVKRLRLQLLAIGVRPKEISVDNYYVDRVKTPRDEHGDYDFECIEAIDLPLLNEHLPRLLAGETVETPRFSFTKGLREEKTVPVRLAPGEVLLIEGIHGLNDRLTESVPVGSKFRIYVSALTQLCIDDHHRIFTSDSRLLRRIVRDRKFRGYSALETLRMWPKVRAGEEKWIFPFQDRADRMFNSTLVYEQAVLKVFAERYLMECPQDDPAWAEAHRLLEFLDLFVPVFADDVPATSILREFIGHSAFDY
jgi:uridine kinase